MEGQFTYAKEVHKKLKNKNKFYSCFLYSRKDAKAAEEAKARFQSEAEKNRLKGEEVAKKKAEKLAAEEAAAKEALENEAANAPAEETAE